MPTETQIIDGFEELRRRFGELNPSIDSRVAQDAPPLADHRYPMRQILEAWAATVLDLEGEGSAAQRRGVRALWKALEERASSNGDGFSVHELEAEFTAEDLRSLISRNPKLLESSIETYERLGESGAADGRFGLAGRVDSLAGEAQAWARVLPKLSGLRAWGFLARLGRPVIVPDAGAKRLLWRLGKIDAYKPRATGDLASVESKLEALARLSGIEMRELGALIRWHTSRVAGRVGGNLCRADPECGECPLAAGCLWNRFGAVAPSQKEAEPPSASASLRTTQERWAQSGPESLDDAEVLALTIYRGGAWAKAVTAAQEAIRRLGGMAGLDQAAIAELAGIKGFGEARALQLKAALELGRRLSLHPLRKGQSITQSEQVWKAFRDRFRHIPQEHFVVLLLDTKNRLIRTCIVSKGTLDSSPAHPREVFKEAVRESASGIILMHNHPSGDPEPSTGDHVLTRKMAEAGGILGIRVLDHIVLGADSYYSFKDQDEL